MSKTMHMGDTTLERLVMAKKRIKDMESQLKATVLIEQGYQDQIAELEVLLEELYQFALTESIFNDREKRRDIANDLVNKYMAKAKENSDD